MIAGVDIGTQSLKVVLCDRELSVIAAASRRYSFDAPRPGWAEQDPALWEAALGPAIAEALDRAGRDASEVEALGLAGQLDGCVAVGASGEALAPCLIWMDRRAIGEMPELDVDRFRDQTGLVADPSHMAAKIRWLAARNPDARRFHQPVSYLCARLTGVDVLDHGHASTTMLYDLAARDWSDALCAAFEVDREILPAIARADEIAGELSAAGAALSGLPAGLPVAVGTGDDFATPIGAGVIAPGQMACVIGTAEVVGAVSDALVLDRRGLLETHGFAGDRYFVENPGWLSGGALRWAGELLGGITDAELDALAADSEPGAGGVTFIPALTGAMSPRWEPGARGCLYGLAASTERADVCRAVLEGCAFAMTDVARRLAELSVPVDEIALLGGGSRSAVSAQIRADASGLPVAPAVEPDSCPIGAAALAAVAAQIHPNLERAVTSLDRRGRRFEPDPAVAGRYAEARDRYLRLFEALAIFY